MSRYPGDLDAHPSSERLVVQVWADTRLLDESVLSEHNYVAHAEEWSERLCQLAQRSGRLLVFDPDLPHDAPDPGRLMVIFELGADGWQSN